MRGETALFCSHGTTTWGQLFGSKVPESLWGEIHEKLSKMCFDAANFVEYAEDEDGRLVAIAKCPLPARSAVFLIDHAWTFKVDEVRRQLRESSTLLTRVEGLTRSPAGPEDLEQRVSAVCTRLWRYVQTYRVATEEQMDPESVWYLEDELGSRIEHDADPNFGCIPLFFAPEQAAYTIAWPIKDIQEGEVLTRDMLNGADNETGQRAVRELVWLDDTETLQSCCSSYDDMVAERGPTFHLPATDIGHPGALGLPSADRHLVFTNSALLRGGLKDPRFGFTENPQEAQVLWVDGARIDPETVKPTQLLNQFPCDEWLNAKDQLCYTIRGKYGRPPWLPMTYDMTCELAAFVGDYTHRQAAREDNTWITKPHRMARSMDVFVTDSLDCLLRLAETGPRVVCKYIHQPVTLQKRKFSVRFTVVVRCFVPLEAFTHEHFTLSQSPNEFSLTDLDDYHTHTTVMMYRPDKECETKLKAPEFIAAFTAEHGPAAWENARSAAEAVIGRALQAGAHRGMHHPAARAIYGADLMWSLPGCQPQLLELTYAPDCHRIVERVPSFYDDVFGALFLGTTQNMRPIFSPEA